MNTNSFTILTGNIKVKLIISFTKAVFVFILFLILMIGFNKSTWGQTILYTENFGATNNVWPATGWTTDGLSNTWTNPLPSTGSQSSGYPGASAGNCPSNGNGGIRTLTFNNNLSTVGFSNITVLWGERRSSSAVNPLIFSWSVNGTNWTAVSYTPPTTTSTWQLVNGGNRIVLPGAEGAANLRFRFTTTNETTATVYRIDDFTIQGTPVPTCPTITALVNLKTDITCYATSDGSITVSASGGVAPYTFSKDNGAPYVTGDNATSHTFSGLLANVVYKIRVKDANGCESPVIP